MKKLLYLSSPTCGPCKPYWPIVEAVAKEKGIEVVKLDIVADPTLVETYAVRSVPTLVLLFEDAIVKMTTGAGPKQKVEEFLK